MKGKSLIILAVLITAATLLFAACNKQNPETETKGSGLHVFVTDENGQTVLDENGEPLTEEWITSVVYATNENGETYTNANGEKVTVKQTRPAYTQIIEIYEYVTDENGQPTKVPKTTTIYKDVTDANGNKVTQTKVDSNGVPVTQENGQPVTEPVTEKYTEKVTNYIELTPDGQQTMYHDVITTKKVNTTSIYDNPLYTDRETKKPTTPSEPKPEKHVASVGWLKTLDASRNDKFVKVIKVDANSYIALGQTESTDGAFSNYTQTGFYSFLAKYNLDGKLIWMCPIGSSGHTKIHDIALLKDGSIVAVGESNAKDLGFTLDSAYDAIIAKVSSDGKLSWIKNYGGTTTEYFSCVTATPDGGFVAAGRFSSTNGDFASLSLKGLTPVFVKCDTNGAIKWYNSFNGSGADAVNSVAVDPEGNIYGACQIISTDLDAKGNHGSADIGIIKLSSTGKKLWTKMIGGSKSDIVNDIYAGAEGCVFAGSYTSSDGDFTLNRGGKDAFIGFCDKQGNVKWIRTFGGLKSDTFNAVVSTGFGYAAVGLTNSDNRDLQTIGNKGEYDGFIMSVNSAGTLEHVKSFAGAGNDNISDICKLDNKTYIAVGETYSSTNDFKDFKISGCSAIFSKCYIY